MTMQGTTSRTRDFTAFEPRMLALYESVLGELDLDAGCDLLDLGCGAGFFLRLAAQRGATVSGIDTDSDLIDLARERVPIADVRVEAPEAFADASFDVITDFRVFPGERAIGALDHAGRVGRPGAPVVISAWGRPDHCEATGCVRAVSELLPSPPPEPIALEALAAGHGLTPVSRREVLCVWTFADEDEALRGLSATPLARQAAAEVGDLPTIAAIFRAIEPYQTGDGGFRLENTFIYLIARI